MKSILSYAFVMASILLSGVSTAHAEAAPKKDKVVPAYKSIDDVLAHVAKQPQQPSMKDGLKRSGG